MKKSIALVITGRQAEALRMGVGLSLADDEINVFIFDDIIEQNDDNLVNIEAMGDMGVKLFTNMSQNMMAELIEVDDFTARAHEFDHVIRY